MDYAKIKKSDLLALITEALQSIPADEDGYFVFEDLQYYYFIEPEQAFMKELTMPPTVEAVRDFFDDVEFLNLERNEGMRDPSFILDRISPLLYYLGNRED